MQLLTIGFLNRVTRIACIVSAVVCLCCFLGATSASAAISFWNTPESVVAGETALVRFDCDYSDVDNSAGESLGRAAIVKVMPAGVAKLFLESSDGSGDVTGIGDETILLPMYENIQGVGRQSKYFGRFVVMGVSPGTADIEVELGESSASVPVTVSPPASISFSRDGNPYLYYPENGEQSLHLDFGYALPEPAVFSVSTSSWQDNIAFAQSSFSVPKGASCADFRFRALDGPGWVELTFTGDTAFTSGSTAFVYITNSPPVVVFPDGTIAITNKTFDTVDLCIQAEDASGDLSSLRFEWYDNGSWLDSAIYGPGRISLRYDEPGTHEIVGWVCDKDGAWSFTVFNCEILPRPVSDWGSGAPELRWKTGGDAEWHLQPVESESGD